MARSRRGRSSSRRRAAPARKMDWVYRSGGYSANDYVQDGLGTYGPLVTAINSGPANANARILYDSRNYLREFAFSAAGPVALGREARAEGRKPQMAMVEGWVYLEPSAWAIGNVAAMGMRVGVYEQSVIDGFISVDANYSMWADGPAESAAMWANAQRQNVLERRIWWGFGDNSAVRTVYFRQRVNRYLSDNECLAIYFEVPNTSVNVRMQCWLRTLVGEP